jgi:repressor LexA
MQPRTRRQKEVFDYIKQYVEKHGYEPSYQLIARHLKVASKAGIAKHIEALEAQGLLSRRRENGSFWLDLTPPKTISDAVCEIEWLKIPKNEIYGEEWENQPLFVPRFLLGYQTPERLLAFRVPNDAMFDEHICAGDVALIEKRSYARDGDIVAALTGNKTIVLKQFYRQGAFIELRPANEGYPTTKLPANKVEILGVYRGLIRPLV